MTDPLTPEERRALAVFATAFLLLATAAYVPIARAHSLGALGGLALPLIMWTPGLSALIASLTVLRSLRGLGLGLRRSSVKWAVAGIAIPLAYTFLIYPPLAALGIVTLGSKNWTFAFLVIGLGQSLAFALGEELGWRGFLVPLMTRAHGFVRGNLFIGVVWVLFHVPAIYFAGYGNSKHVVFGLVMFTVVVIALGFVLAWMRLASLSVWPAALFHAEHNNSFLHLFDPMKRVSPLAGYLVGEMGALLAIVMVALAVLAVRRARRG